MERLTMSNKQSRMAAGASAADSTVNPKLASQDCLNEVFTPLKYKLTRLWIVDSMLWEGLQDMTDAEQREWAKKMRAWAWQVESLHKLKAQNEPFIGGLTRAMLATN